MLPDSFLIFIVLAPGVAALVAGLFQRFIGDRGAMVVTTATVGMAGLLSLYQLFAYASGMGGEHAVHAADTGHAASYVGGHIITLLSWIDVGQFKADWAIRVDAMSIVMMAVITSVSGLVHLYSWGYMSRHAHVGDGRQLHSTFLWLGRCWSCFISSDRVLVPQEGAERRVDQSLCNEPGWGFWPCTWHYGGFLDLWIG